MLYSGVMKGEMRPDIIFPALTLFSLIRFPILFYLRWFGYVRWMLLLVWIGLQKYFLLSESKPTTTAIKLEELNEEDNGEDVKTKEMYKKKEGTLLRKSRKARRFDGAANNSNKDAEKKMTPLSPQGC